jgi:ferredoxin-NADP reductase
MHAILPRFRPLDQRKPWDSQAQELECIMIIPETHNVRTFCFQTMDGSWFRYLPGQFITLEFTIAGKKVQRTYTLSSSPSRPTSISVTVKAQEDSVASKWMHENLKVGDRVKAYGPAGLFSFVHNPADKYLFISGGSGITPLMSMTRWLFDEGLHTDINFIHCARMPSEIIFRPELEQMAMRVPDIRVTWVVKDEEPYRAWTGFRGRLNQLVLELAAPDYFEREIFCCGPAPFMQTVRDILLAVGYDMDHYHEESFAAPIRQEADAPVHDDVVPDEAAMAELIFTLSGQSVKCRETDTILDVAREVGLNIPSACQFGVCGTCKTRKTGGDVHMIHNGGITDDEVAEGYFLACCSKPIGRVEIEA